MLNVTGGLKVYLDMEIQYVGEGHPWWTQSLGKPDAPFADFLLWKDKPGGEAEPVVVATIQGDAVAASDLLLV